MRIVLDTNSLIQSIPVRSQFRAVWQSILTGENTLCVTNEILEEYEEILQRLAGKRIADYTIETLLECRHVELIVPFYRFNLIQSDPDDNKFVDCAIAGHARYVVTNDHHYDVLRHIQFPIVDVIALKDFLQLIQPPLEA